MTSRDDDLTARIRQQTESTMQEHGETLRASANNELRITEADIKQMHGQIRDMLPRTKAEVEKQIAQIHATLEKGLARTQWLLLRAWLRPLMVGLVISLGIFGASWGLMQWLSSRVQNLLETQETLQLGIAQQQRDLEQLQAQTWGLDGAVRTHHRGLQGARRFFEAGKNRIEQRIEHTRDSGRSR